MAAIDTTDLGILSALRPEINRLIWNLFNIIKDDTIPIHISIFRIPINIDVKISNLKDIITKLVGPEITDDLSFLPPNLVLSNKSTASFPTDPHKT